MGYAKRTRASKVARVKRKPKPCNDCPKKKYLFPRQRDTRKR